MSKRASDSTRPHSTQVKKRKGVGFRTIAVPDSDEEDLPPTASNEFALVTKTRIGVSGQSETISISSVQILEEQESGSPTPLEETTENSVDIIKDLVPTMPAKPAKPKKKINDSVSNLSTLIPLYY